MLLLRSTAWLWVPLADLLDEHAVSVMVDIVKFYENLRHDVLWQCAVEHGFNLRLLRGLLVFY